MTIPDDDRRKLSVDEVGAALAADFRQIQGFVLASYDTGDYDSALALVNAISAAAAEADHHPDLRLGWGRVDVRLWSHDVRGLTQRDLRLAERITTIAAEAGARPVPARVQMVDLGLDTWDAEEILPFWRAILGYADPEVADEIVDSVGLLPSVWFQGTDRHETPRQRWHLDVWVPVDEARRRVDAALAAGGTLVYDAESPAFWVLADAQGNRACVASVESR